MHTKRGRPLVLAIVTSFVLAVGAFALSGSAPGGEIPNDIPKGEEWDKRLAPGIVDTDLAPDSPIALSVARHLPRDSRINSVFDRVDADDPDGPNAVHVSTVVERTGYEVTIYRDLSVEEIASGRAWTAAADPDITSIYYLTSTGVGLRVAHLSPETPAAAGQLITIAVAVASEPAVIEEAGK